MDIHKIHPGQISERRLDRSQERQLEGKDIDQQVGNDDRTQPHEVSLSDRAKSLTQATAGAAPFDAAKVDAIREAITEGRYHVDPERLAQRFMDLEKHKNQ